MLLGHIVCKECLLVDPVKIVLILSLLPSTNVKMLRATLGHIGYYCKSIKGYAAITAPMEKLLKKGAAFEWSQECQGIFDTLKAKMASTPILVFRDWNKECMSTPLLLHWGLCLRNQVRATWITQSHMRVGSCHLLNEITQRLKEKDW